MRKKKHRQPNTRITRHRHVHPRIHTLMNKIPPKKYLEQDGVVVDYCGGASRSSRTEISRMRNFCTLPDTVIGNWSLKSQ